jgi:hypothetical protein
LAPTCLEHHVGAPAVALPRHHVGELRAGDIDGDDPRIAAGDGELLRLEIGDDDAAAAAGEGGERHHDAKSRRRR